MLMLCSFVSPFVCWVVNAFVLPGRKRWFFPFVFASAIVYVSILAGAQAREFELERAIERYERNGESQTPEAQKAVNQWASDTGRTFAPILGLPLAFIWTTINFAVLAFVEWSFRTDFRSILNRHVQSPDADEPESPQRIEPDSGDPYQPPAKTST